MPANQSRKVEANQDEEKSPAREVSVELSPSGDQASDIVNMPCLPLLTLLP